MNKQIITIGREFGSGGRSIGKQVAEQLGIDYYDKELVRQIAVETGFDERFVAQAGEYAPSKSWLAFGFAPKGTQGIMDGMSTNDFLWAVQVKVIRDLAEKGPCVIVGRCADYILRERTDCLHVFIHSDPQSRAERIVRLYGASEKSPEKRIQEKDKRRKTYYKHYTDRDWGMSQNYHLALNTGVIGIARSVEMIIQLAEEV